MNPVINNIVRFAIARRSLSHIAQWPPLQRSENRIVTAVFAPPAFGITCAKGWVMRSDDAMEKGMSC